MEAEYGRKNNWVRIAALIASYLMVATLASAVTLFAFGQRGENGKLSEMAELIDERFIGEVDKTAMEDAAAKAMVSATGDRWSYYIPADQYESHMEQMNNAYVGVGITIQAEEDGQGFRIMAVTDGSGAQEAGMLPGDLLVEVTGQDVRGMTASQVRELVRGKEGTAVSMTVLREERRLTLDVERRKLETPVARGQMVSDTVGYVSIQNFDARCAQETIAAIEELRQAGAEKFVFDVRNNPGGYADELVQVLDYLLPEGEVFHTVRYDGKEQIDRSDEACLGLPMAVLVNGESYSAAEFFAAALQEYEAGVVVGEKTVGKGYFQSTFPFSDGSAVGLSIGKYYTPKGENLAGTGVTPDVACPVDEKTAAAIYYGTLPLEEDPQLQAAIEALDAQ